MLSQRINKWFSTFGKSFFTYKDGFFEVPYLANSPRALVQTLIKSRFVKHNENDQTLKSNNPFLRGITCYQEIEDGLWLLYGDYEYKKNVSFRRVDDKQLSCDYYSIRLTITSTKGKGKLAVVNGISYSHNTWFVFKPGATMNIFHFKGSKELSLTVFFSEEWLKQVLSKTDEYKNSSIIYFFESKTKYIIWPETMELSEVISNPLMVFLQNKMKGVKSFEKEELKKHSLDFINLFINKYNREEVSKHFYEIPDSERLKILKAEHLLIQNIQAPFIGIEALAKEVSISPTQLKSHFKMIFGETVFQYFRHKQMEYAFVVLKNKNTNVKEVARQLGYENPSKFTAAFKEQYNVLPSEV